MTKAGARRLLFYFGIAPAILKGWKKLLRFIALSANVGMQR